MASDPLVVLLTALTMVLIVAAAAMFAVDALI
jgi:hypothetical protein